MTQSGEHPIEEISCSTELLSLGYRLVRRAQSTSIWALPSAPSDSMTPSHVLVVTSWMDAHQNSHWTVILLRTKPSSTDLLCNPVTAEHYPAPPLSRAFALRGQPIWWTIAHDSETCAAAFRDLDEIVGSEDVLAAYSALQPGLPG
jgi:hypothetical protein